MNNVSSKSKNIKINKTVKFWDKLSKNYDKKAKDNSYEIILRKTKKYLKSSDVVLDFGCATGLYSIELASNVKAIHGIDISPKMIEVAKKNTALNTIDSIIFSNTPIFDEGLKKESFNAVLSLNIIHFLENTQKGIQRLNELLRPGGLIISSTACMGEKSLLNTIVFYLMKIGIFPKFRFFKKKELEDIITQGGFQIIETEILPYNLTTEYFIVAKKI